MAGNRRGKIKEHLEGIHRNCEWIKQHVVTSLALIEQHNPKLSDSFKSLAEIAEQLDKFAGSIYTKI